MAVHNLKKNRVVRNLIVFVLQFHTNFVNVARFSKNGEVVLSGGADGKVC